jgi:hypothetical protein
VPSGAAAASAPRVVFVPQPARQVVSPSAPAAAHKPAQATKSAAPHGARGSKASAASRAPASTRPAAALADIALEPGPRAPSAPPSDPAAAKHNLGF